MEFKERLRLIISGEYEFTEEEKAIIERCWMTEEDRLMEQYASAIKKMNDKTRERRIKDELFNEWYKAYNALNVTLARIKKDGKDRTEYVTKCIERLEIIHKMGYEPAKTRETKINWPETFRQKKVIHNDITQERKKKNKWTNKYLQQKVEYEGQVLTLQGLRYRFKKMGIPQKEASKYIIGKDTN